MLYAWLAQAYALATPSLPAAKIYLGHKQTGK